MTADNTTGPDGSDDVVDVEVVDSVPDPTLTLLVDDLAALSDHDFDHVVATARARRGPVPGAVPGVPVVAAPHEVDAPFVPGAPAPSGYTDAGVPTFDGVRERVEGRVGRAIGAEELDRDSRSGRSIEEQFAQRKEAAAAKLDAIRRSLGSGSSEEAQHP